MSDDLRPLKVPTSRQIRIVIWGLLLVVVAAALIAYLVFDWRGKAAWADYVRDARARGKWIEASAVIPPPIPEERNFGEADAFKPLFAYETSGELKYQKSGFSGNLTYEIRTEQGDPDGLRRINVRFVPITEASQRFPELFPWVHGAPIDLQSWRKYYAAGATVSRRGEVSPGKAVLDDLSQFDEAYGKIRVAAARPLSRFPIHYQEVVGQVPHVRILLQIAQLAALRAACELSLDRMDDAFDDSLLSLRMAEAIEGEPYILSASERMWIIRVALQPIWEGLTRHCWSESQLTEFATRFGRIHLASDYRQALLGERCLVMFPLIDEFKRDRWVWVDSNTGGAGGAVGNIATFAINCLPDGTFDGSKAVVGRIVDSSVAAVDPAAGRFYPDRIDEVDKEISEARQAGSIFSSRLMGDCVNPIVRLAQRLAYVQGKVHLARIAFALERYRVKNGNYPAQLADLRELIPGDTSLPDDPASGHAAHYKLLAGGKYSLYYDGWNGIDDGGVSPKEEAESYMSGQILSGDWVWPQPTVK